MSITLNIGVVGLGVMGQRMLDRLDSHPRLKATWVWDANPEALRHTLVARPALQAAASADQLITSPGLRGLYIATPPAAHMALSHTAFDAGLAVLCEKPLTLDFDAARRTVARIAREAQRAAVNFSLASSPGLEAVQQAFGSTGAHALGVLQEVEIDLAFAAWPRPWQAAAGAWLSQRIEGGFTREVLSHFIFVLQRVLGKATVLNSDVSHPADGIGAETALQARLQVAGVAVRVTGRVDPGLQVADHNRMLWRGSSGAIELRQWFGVARRHHNQEWEPLGDAAVLRATGQADQLEQWAKLVDGRLHGLPGFAEALAVQDTIETLLDSGRTAGGLQLPQN